MKVTSLYIGTDGESHFEDIDIALENVWGVERRSEPMKATGILFRETGGDYNIDWHNAPRRQFVIMLEGHVEVIVGAGSKRLFGPGDILLAEDTTGRGHISHAVNGQARMSIFVTLD